MSRPGGELHALAMSMVSEGVPRDQALDRLVAAADGDRLVLLGACSWAEATARSFPLDEAVARVLQLLRDAVRQAGRRAPTGVATPTGADAVTLPSPHAAESATVVAELWRAGDVSGFTDDLYIDLDRLRTPVAGRAPADETAQPA